MSSTFKKVLEAELEEAKKERELEIQAMEPKAQAIHRYIDWYREQPEFKKAYEDLIVQLIETGQKPTKEQSEERMKQAQKEIEERLKNENGTTREQPSDNQNNL